MRLWSKNRALFAATGLAALIALGGLVTARRTVAQDHDDGPAPTNKQTNTIIQQAVAAADTTASAFRSVDPVHGPKRPTKMVIAVVARNGRLIRVFSQPDAWVGSIDIAIAKARTAAFFSSNENALTSRIIGDASQPGGPLWGIGNSNQVGITGNPEFRNGIITFPGGLPLYAGGTLIGGVGVSGDAVDQDEFVAFKGAVGFEPGANVVKLGFTIPSVPAFP